MKRMIPSPATVISFLFPIFLFIVQKKRKAGIIYLLIFVLAGLGCFKNFYHTNTKKSVSDSTILKLQKEDKHFVAYLESGVYSLYNMKINDKVIESEAVPINEYQTKFLNPPPGSNAYKKVDEDVVLNEVQIYARSQKLLDSGHVSLPMSSITRVDVFTKDKGRTNSNHILSWVGLTAFIGLGILILAACNCPQVYAYDGHDYQFRSGVFSGAIYSSIERTDYLPLDTLISENGKFKFRLMNNQQEEQNINQVALMKIAHDPQIHILLDRNGQVHSFQDPVLPVSSSMEKDNVAAFRERDAKSYLFNQKSDSSSGFGSVILSFDKPAGTKEAKLIVYAKNSSWAGYIFDDFISLFGTKYQQYQSRQDRANREKLDRWQKEQALSLMAYVETEKGWQFVDYFPTTGNTAGRNMIMAIKIPENNSNKIRIKLESAFMFWELDYAGLDFSPDQKLQPEWIPASSAIKSSVSDNELGNLASIDKQYSKLLQNEFLSIDFDAPVALEANSYFLVSTGYYHSLKQYEGKPDIGLLKQFRKKGFFSEYSEARFNETQELLAKGIHLKGETNHN